MPPIKVPACGAGGGPHDSAGGATASGLLYVLAATNLNASHTLGVWLPAIQGDTGASVFTRRLAAELPKRGIRAEISWLPLRAEYAPWTVPVPKPPPWATVAHVNTWLPPRFLPKQLPVIATLHHAVHHADAMAYKGRVRTAYHRWWIAPNERRVLRRAQQVVAVSGFVAATAKRMLLDVPIEVIYNGVDTNYYRPGKRQQRSGGPFRLLYVGRWRRLKGVDLLAPIMRELGDGFELRYTGGPAAQREHAALAANMHDLGRLAGDAVVAAMQDADALLFPSRSEGLGLVAIEAMACGLPVIATRGSSLPEVVDDDITGILCPRDEVLAFANAARRLAQDRAFYQHASVAARDRVIQKFSQEQMLNEYGRVYASIAGR